MKTTQIILNEPSLIKRIKSKEVYAFIASLFSILFSLSIVGKLENVVDTPTLIFLGVFTVLFLIANERYKVKCIRVSYTSKTPVIVLGLLITLSVSIGLSCIGVYYWSNRSNEQITKVTTDKLDSTQKIINEYDKKITNNNTYLNEIDPLYNDLQKQLDFWKDRKPMTLAERKDISSRIVNIESQMLELRKQAKQKQLSRNEELIRLRDNELNSLEVRTENSLSQLDENNFISTIFIVMVLLVEIGILVFNLDLANEHVSLNELKNSEQAIEYKLCRKIAMHMFMSLKDNNRIWITDIVHSPLFGNLDWDREKKWMFTKKIFNQLVSINVIENPKIHIKTTGSKTPYGFIHMSEDEAINKIDDCYEKLMDISFV